MAPLVRFLIFGLVLVVSGCNEKKPVSISFVETLKPGQTKNIELKRQLGSPDEVINIPEDGDLLWVYLDPEKHGQRASFEFSKDGVLLTALVETLSLDPERDLQQALKRFPNSHFTKEDVPWEKGTDYAPNETNYEDQENGLTIEVRKSTGEVTSISWYVPSGKRSTAQSKPAS